MHDSFVQVQCSHAFCYLLNCQENVGKQNKLEDEILFLLCFDLFRFVKYDKPKWPDS